MPVTLPPISRRQFLVGTAVAGFATLGAPACAAAKVDADRIALLADVHIPANPQTTSLGVNMTDNLAAVGKQLIGLEKQPAAVLIGGDCAHLSGKQGDYANLVKLVQPIRKVGMPVHLLLGNHDDRANLLAAVAPADKASPVKDKYVAVLRGRQANWFLLDSMEQVNHTSGRLGAKQLAWLATALDENKDKPALILLHHNPYKHQIGLVDYNELFAVLSPRKQAKAVVFGHTHAWGLDKRDGIHLVNLPPVAYVFKQGMPNGWVDAQLAADHISLRLVCHNTKHPLHGKVTELAWRS